MPEEATSPTTQEVDGGNTPTSEPGKSYTQDELDRIVAQRVQKSKAQFKDYDEYKQAAQRLAELEAQGQSEGEKLRAQLEKLKTEAQQATEREQAALTRANDTLIRAAVVGEASRQGAIDPDAVVALLDRAKLQINEQGEVDGVGDAVKTLLAERSYLLAPRSGFDGGPRDTAPAASSRADFNQQLRRVAGF